MKCPYCAEDIKDEAILCRFCGARLVDGKWEAPAAVTPASLAVEPRPRRKHPSSFTIRTAGFFFMLTAAFEAFSITSPIVLTANPITGVSAIVYHVFYIIVFLAIGYGLWTPAPWGFLMMLAGTIVYTAEKIVCIFNPEGRTNDVMNQLNTYGAKDLVDAGYIVSILNIMNLVFIACWWGFVIYLYFKRDYFKNRG